MLLILKLPAGRLVSAPLLLKYQKKLDTVHVADAPNRDIAGITDTYTLLAVVHSFGINVVPPETVIGKSHILFAVPRVIVYVPTPV
jgi:hypothetical protein